MHSKQRVSEKGRCGDLRCEALDNHLAETRFCRAFSASLFFGTHLGLADSAPRRRD